MARDESKYKIIGGLCKPNRTNRILARGLDLFVYCFLPYKENCMEQQEQSAFGRRDFLKTTAVIGAFGALSSTWTDGLVPKAHAATPINYDRTDTKIVKTNCRACTHNCGVLAHVKDGRVIKLEGNPEHPMSKGAMCAKGLAGIQALYHPNRNKYPMKRMGARGENKWKRVSWKEAIDELATRLMESYNKYGAESLFCSTGGGGNPGFYSISRFCNAFETPNWFEPGCSQCFLPRTAAYGIMYGGPATSIGDSLALEMYLPDTQMKTVIQWGSNASYNSPAGGGRELAQLRAKPGVKTVSIDPRLTPDAAKADVWLPIRPGTDVALMLAWIRYIIDEKLYDHEFVLKWTNLPFLVNTKTKMIFRENEFIEGGRADTFMVWDQKTQSAKPLTYPWDDALDPALFGTYTVNGVQYKTGMTMLREKSEEFTIAKAAEICVLDPKKIVEAINIFAKNGPGGIVLGVATDQFPNSTQAAIGSVILNSLVGNVERPGALMQRFPSSKIGPYGTYMVGPGKKLLPKEQLLKRLGGIEHKGMLQWWAAHISSIQDAVLTGKPYKPRMWIERSGNKFNVLANAGSWVPALEQLDYVVHVFLYPTSFSTYADLLLPCTEWLETECLVETMNVVNARQAVVHTWETMDETLFWSKLAKRCAELGHENCKRAFDAEFMGEDMPYWDTMEELLDLRLKKIFNTTWKEFVKTAPYTFKPQKEWATSSYNLHKKINPSTGKPIGFGTPSKKLELYGECWITLGRTGRPWTTYDLPPASKDYDPLPYYMEPVENPNNEIGKQFPLTMTNGRLPVFHHGTLRNAPYIREIFPVAEIWVNPIAAKKYGVAQGDWANVESLRGKIKAKVRVTEGISPNTVYMERFWNPETVESPTRGWQEMNVNVLSIKDGPFNDICGTYTLRGYQVRISKADGAPKGVWEKPEEFKPWMPQPSEATPFVRL